MSEREKVFSKYDGRCAYCGELLQKGWHVDHMLPIRRSTSGCDHPERDCFENKVPACVSCNINKHQLGIEEFRKLIAGFMKHLNEISTQYKVAKRYGLIQETNFEVKFYFEATNTNDKV
jgi:5-methylcytosine-specific restriction endonuclease McrA